MQTNTLPVGRYVQNIIIKIHWKRFDQWNMNVLYVTTIRQFIFIHLTIITTFSSLGRRQTFRQWFSIRVKWEKSAASIKNSWMETIRVVYEHKVPGLHLYCQWNSINLLINGFKSTHERASKRRNVLAHAHTANVDRSRECRTWGTLMISQGTFICLRASTAPS